MKKLYAQGDVLLVPVASIPEGALAVSREAGRLVLAHGEVTGHAHAITSLKARLMRFQDQTFLDVGSRVATLKHEEHGAIDIPRGTYRVIKQREYQFGQAQRVAD